uniref:Uncharacterized protein n=1 Tax=Anopheles funestus TaxID=62324 RepID=A0A182R596_ANOFN
MKRHNVALILCSFAIVFITTTVGQVEPKWPIPAIYRRQHQQRCIPGGYCPEDNQIPQLADILIVELRKNPGVGTAILSSVAPVDRLIRQRTDTIPHCTFGSLGCPDVGPSFGV